MLPMPPPAAGEAVRADAIEGELARLFASEPFKTSRRAQSFLGFVVRQALANPAAEVYERQIAVELSGRAGDYDPAGDAIVRVTAHDVRKRLAQFYDGQTGTSGLRLELPLGGHTPRFHLEPAAPEGAEVPPETGRPRRGWRR